MKSNIQAFSILPLMIFTAWNKWVRFVYWNQEENWIALSLATFCPNSLLTCLWRPWGLIGFGLEFDKVKFEWYSQWGSITFIVTLNTKVWYNSNNNSEVNADFMHVTLLSGIHSPKTSVHHLPSPLLERSSKPISTQRLILLSLFFFWLLCGADLVLSLDSEFGLLLLFVAP